MYDIFGKYGAIRQIRMYVVFHLLRMWVADSLTPTRKYAEEQHRTPREQRLLCTRTSTTPKTPASTWLASTSLGATSSSSIISSRRPSCARRISKRRRLPWKHSRPSTISPTMNRTLSFPLLFFFKKREIWSGDKGAACIPLCAKWMRINNSRSFNIHSTFRINGLVPDHEPKIKEEYTFYKI